MYFSISVEFGFAKQTLDPSAILLCERYSRKRLIDDLQILHKGRFDIGYHAMRSLLILRDLQHEFDFDCRFSIDFSIFGCKKRVRVLGFSGGFHSTSYFFCISRRAFWFQSSALFSALSSNHFSFRTSATKCPSFLDACFFLASSLVFFHFATQKTLLHA